MTFNKFLNSSSNWAFFKHQLDPMTKKRYLAYAKVQYEKEMDSRIHKSAIWKQNKDD